MANWRFGIIGCGTVADFHMEAIRQIDEAKLTYVSSRNEAKAKEVAEQEKCAWTTDYHQLLSSPEVDIVCVTTSSGSHATIGLDVLRAGKHLVIEKPIAMHAQDAEKLVRTAKEMGVQLSVISQRRFEAQNQAIKRVLDEGGLGKLLLVEVSLPFFRSQAYYDSAGWRGTRDADGGVLMNQGIHSLDLLLWFAGEAKSVFGKIATQTHAMEAEDLGLAIVQFENGALGSIMASTSMNPGFAATIHLYGEKGTIKLEGSTIVHWTVPGWSEPNRTARNTYGGISDPRDIVSDFHQSQLIDVMTSIETEHPPLITGEDGLRAVQLVERIYHSAAQGRELAMKGEHDA
ncbi:NAD(P)-dependent oxidoreductase [Paenibacillus pectinilyticus]|uniref:NAD(P)-dependent oxidoreductase n=1 Tax=Paenibacillus pectinilyticus TaxID=512399 RepID=A0A1C1A4T7_9BACL|nr:Gfo/Idh/MocA family oxidoreductase [Paenibacillus pectinilyticus]OCT15569.1 NAD(P)-dependent oxidoreductase [Paenibacillus pectinilyticus]